MKSNDSSLLELWQAGVIRRHEKRRHKPPTSGEIRQVVSIIRDFGYYIDVSKIPDFKTESELDLWRRSFTMGKTP